MRTHSYVSAVALAAALLTTPQLAHAQGLHINLGADILGIDADASVELGGEQLLDVDADVDTGSNDGISVDAGVNAGGDDGLDVDAGVSVGGSEPDDSLLDVDLDATAGSDDDSLVDVDLGVGPNGGKLIDLRDSDEALVDADIDLLGGGTEGGSASLLTGGVRIAALDDDEARRDALLDRIAEPNLADIDLDAAVDDTRVSILAAADLLGPDGLAEIEAALAPGGEGRTALRDALSASIELGSILGEEGIDLDDVLAIDIGQDGATQVIVLRDGVQLALLGDNGNLADADATDLADLDVDLLSREELAEIDLDLLPDDLRTTAQLRLLGSEGDPADSGTAGLADIDLDLLSRDELAELDLTLLPEPVAGAIEARLLAGDDDLANLDIALLSDTAPADDEPGTGGAPGAGDSPGDDPGAGDNPGNGGGSVDDTDGGTDVADGDDGTSIVGDDTVSAPGAIAGTPVGASFGIASLDCDIGVLALANGTEATPQAIADAETLELVTIDGCERGLIDPEADAIRGAIADNPAISSVLDDASIPLDEVIGATIQGDTLTVFVEPVVI